MKNKRRLQAVCIAAAFVIAAASIAVIYYKNNTVKAAANSSSATTGLTDISDYHKKITVSNSHLPPAEILDKGGNGLQLYDTQGKYINGDEVLNGNKDFTAFLRVLWLDNRDSDLSLVVLVDNHIQPFKVDESMDEQAMLDFSMQPKSLMNIPLTMDAVGDSAQENSTITFLLLYNNPDQSQSDQLSLPNETNDLSYKITNLQKKDYTDCTLAADHFENQNDGNATLTKSKGFYSVLSAKSDDNFTFYQEKQKLNISDVNLNLYAMGSGSRTTLMLIGDKLTSPFENKSYLTYTLDDSQYLKQKLTFADYAEGDRLTMIHILRNTSARYSVVCHSLTKS